MAAGLSLGIVLWVTVFASIHGAPGVLMLFLLVLIFGAALTIRERVREYRLGIGSPALTTGDIGGMVRAMGRDAVFVSAGVVVLLGVVKIEQMLGTLGAILVSP